MIGENYFRWGKRLTKVSRKLLGILIFLVFAGTVAGSSQAALVRSSATQQGPEDDPATVFGVELNPLDDSGGLQQMAATEAGWVRGVVIDWAVVENSQGNINWNDLDDAAEQLENAADAGLEPMVMVRGVPQWARTVANQKCGPIHPNYYDDFGDFIAEVITDYPSIPNPFAAVQYWSIWNEPDIDPDDLESPSESIIGCWGDEDDEYYGGKAYGNMLNAVYPRLKGANDQTVLIAGELLLDCDPRNPDVPCDPEPASFLEGILQVSDAFDVIGFHAYDYYLGETGKYENLNWDASWTTTGPVLIAKAQFIRDKLNEHGITGKFIMNTEFALLWDLGSDPELEDTKAFYLAQAYASAIAYDFKANIWFDATGTWERNNGLLDRDTLDPLPAYAAYQFASEKLKGAVPVAPDIRWDRVMYFPFDNAVCSNPENIDCRVWVLWSLDETGAQITLPGDPERVENYYGDVLSGITQTLTLAPGPYYIEVDAEVPGFHSVLLDPNPVYFSNQLTIFATMDDTMTGGSPIASAEYSLDSGITWLEMGPLDGNFDSETEVVTATLTAPSVQGSYDYNVCIQGADVWGNVSAGCTPITLVVLDNAGPITTAFDPVTAGLNQALTISAMISDTLTGGSIIQSAEYSLAGGSWTQMQAQDGFNSVTELVSATLTTPSVAGGYTLCVRGTDYSLNIGEEECSLLTVFSPDGPLAAELLVNPNPAKTNQPLTISATVDDSLKGGLMITRAEYSLDNGASWSPMAAGDGTFDQVMERVHASTNAPPVSGLHSICVRGVDSNNNIGGPICTDLPVSLYTVGLSMLTRNWYIGGLPPNGDFSSGLEDWVSYTTYLPVSPVTDHPINPVEEMIDEAIPIGSGSAVLGNPDAGCGNNLPFGPDVYVGLEQEVVLPDVPTSLRFKYVIYSQDIGYSQVTNTYYDTFEVYVNQTREFTDSNNVNELQCKWHRVPSEENPRPDEASGWATGSVDLSAYSGQKVTIAFRSYSRYDGWFNTYIFLDDVMVVPNE